MTERLALPAAAALALLTLALWVYLLLFQAAGVQVANRSGAVLGGLSVCPASGKCLHRAQLWPQQTWQIPLERPAGGPLRLTVREVDGQRQMLSHTPRSAEKRASFVVGQDGRIVVQ